MPSVSRLATKSRNQSTESLISPKGGAMKPATLSPTPEANMPTAVQLRRDCFIATFLSHGVKAAD